MISMVNYLPMYLEFFYSVALKIISLFNGLIFLSLKTFVPGLIKALKSKVQPLFSLQKILSF